MKSSNWKLTLPCTRLEAEALHENDEALSALDPIPSIVTEEIEAFNDLEWRLLAYFYGKPSAAAIRQIQKLLPSAANAAPHLEQLPDEDWLTLSQQYLEPVSAGRFYVHTATNTKTVPENTVAFRIEASQAFGTGGHETTTGCLKMLDAMKRRGQKFEIIADIGTGTGLLAFAAQNLWPRAYVTASDIDPISIAVTASNADNNNIILGHQQGRIALCVASGTDHELIQGRAPYDLIIANILAGPLIELAASLSAIIQNGGSLILAGLLNTQISAVARAYRAHGFRVAERVDTGDWPCIRLIKRRNFGWRRQLRDNRRTMQPPGDFGTW